MSGATRGYCSSCRHFDGENEEQAKKGDGQCRRRAPTTQILMTVAAHPITGRPTSVPQQFSVFPQVSREQCYCSEWEGKGFNLLNS